MAPRNKQEEVGGDASQPAPAPGPSLPEQAESTPGADDRELRSACYDAGPMPFMMR